MPLPMPGIGNLVEPCPEAVDRSRHPEHLAEIPARWCGCLDPGVAAALRLQCQQVPLQRSLFQARFWLLANLPSKEATPRRRDSPQTLATIAVASLLFYAAHDENCHRRLLPIQQRLLVDRR